MDVETSQELEKLSKSLGRLLGATALWREARKKGINVSKSDVKAFVEKISSKQVLAPGPASLGKSATTTASGAIEATGPSDNLVGGPAPPAARTL